MAGNLTTPKASFSIPSIISVLAAIGSFMNGAILGMVLAVTAIIFGVIGVLLSIAPAKRGGILSIASIGAGVVGIIAAVIKAFIWIFS